MAVLTIFSNVEASFIARSERIFLSSNILLLDSPFIRAEYDTPKALEPALIRAIHNALNSLFLFFLSLKAY